MTGSRPAEEFVEVTEDTLVGKAGIAEFFGVTLGAVYNWAARRHYNGFPEPEPILYAVGRAQGRRNTEVWALLKVIEWRNAYRPKVGNPIPRPRGSDGRFL